MSPSGHPEETFPAPPLVRGCYCCVRRLFPVYFALCFTLLSKGEAVFLISQCSVFANRHEAINREPESS